MSKHIHIHLHDGPSIPSEVTQLLEKVKQGELSVEAGTREAKKYRWVIRKQRGGSYVAIPFAPGTL